MFWFRKKKTELKPEDLKINKGLSVPKPIDFTKEVIDEDLKEIVSIITSAIAAHNNSESQFRVKSIREVDEDKVACAVIASAIMANDVQESKFRLISIKETKSVC